MEKVPAYAGQGFTRGLGAMASALRKRLPGTDAGSAIEGASRVGASLQRRE